MQELEGVTQALSSLAQQAVLYKSSRFFEELHGITPDQVVFHDGKGRMQAGGDLYQLNGNEMFVRYWNSTCFGHLPSQVACIRNLEVLEAASQ